MFGIIVIFEGGLIERGLNKCFLLQRELIGEGAKLGDGPK